jgi:hypothetical protein
VKEQTIERRKVIISSHPTSGESKQVHSCEVVSSQNQLYGLFGFAN